MPWPAIGLLLVGGVAASLAVLAVPVATCVVVWAVIVDLPHRVGRQSR